MPKFKVAFKKNRRISQKLFIRT